jgi:hypothetical protein
MLGSNYSALLIHVNKASQDWAEWAAIPSVSAQFDVPFRPNDKKALSEAEKVFLTVCMQPSKVLSFFGCECFAFSASFISLLYAKSENSLYLPNGNG